MLDLMLTLPHISPRKSHYTKMVRLGILSSDLPASFAKYLNSQLKNMAGETEKRLLSASIC